MKCPYCGDQESKVIDSRHSDDLSIRRRRECCRCGHRFTTYESVESQPILVVERIATEIEQTIQNSLEREVTTERLGEMVMERLKPVDEVAYIRFASIYHQFQDAGSFMREISKYLEEK